MYADRARAAVAALASAMEGLDALVFTAGVGENAPAMRREICRGLDFMGIALDDAHNRDASGDADIAAKASARVFVIQAREDLVLAREALRVALSEGSRSVHGSNAGSTSSPGL